MPPNREWLQALNADCVGAIWWSNLCFDLANSNMPPGVAEEFYGAVENELRTLAPSTSSSKMSPLIVIDLVLNNGSAAFDLRGRRMPGRRDSYSRVVNVTLFAFHHVNWSTLGLEADESTPNRVWDLLGSLITEDYYTGQMRTRRAFFWCTPSRSLAIIESAHDASDVATEVRDALGLYNEGKGQRLLRIDIPDKALSGKRLCAPITLDGGVSICFVPSVDSSGLGWTLHLERLEPGVEELLIEELPFTSEFKVTKIGSIRESAPVIDCEVITTRSRETGKS